MNKLATAFVSLAVLLGAAVLAAPAEASTAGTGALKFGMDAQSVSKQSAAGAKPDYGTLWIGPWTLTTGWAGPNAELLKLKNAGVTPVVHLYYWGDDISPSCIESGCWSSLHKTQKTQAGWQKLTDQLGANLRATMGGKPVVVILETEFNKANMNGYETFDGQLATKAKQVRAAYPAAQVVLGLGNWNSAAWGTWDRAAAASDMIGLQGMRGSTRDSTTSAYGLYEATLAGAKAAQTKFGKPVFITDIAVSSYPTSTWAAIQESVIKEFFANLGPLKAAGVRALVYRAWVDDPTMDLANYYGTAERHWGFVTSAGVQKATAKAWVSGVQKERASPATGGTTATTTTGTFTATFTPTSKGNDWWLETKVSSTQTVTKVDARVNGGAWTSLPKTSYGTWAKSVHAPDGAKVEFRATSSTGAVSNVQAFTW
ncbi:MAG TPA: hypothetical protein VFH47_00185 [Candidatus Thermoplasmatota archaeon]|nr:hypothetical protein [Candidatus Thermoplasmatota archaeon]